MAMAMATAGGAAAVAAAGLRVGTSEKDVSFGTSMSKQAMPVKLTKKLTKTQQKTKLVGEFSSQSHRSVVAAIALPQEQQQQHQQGTSTGSRVEIGRSVVRLGLPSKGRMAEGTLNLLNECSLPVRKLNPRQYIADIPGLDNLEVWFQRESDVVRKLRTGDIDMGILGYDVLAEFGEDDEDLIIVHDALGFGKCHLSVAVPTYGIFDSISTLEELAAMPQWTEERPLRICTGFTHVGTKFLKEKGLKYVTLSTADGALEAAPAMGTADAILDLVSSGVTLRENNLKEVEGGQVLSSEGVFVASKKALLERKGVLESARELLERLEAHLRARGQFTVIANMRGTSEQDVAERLLHNSELVGLQGPTISPVYSRANGATKVEYYAVVICVAKPQLYEAVRQLRSEGGSGVLVTPLTYIFDEEPPRWLQLLKSLDLA
ncbi:unnamed protein product [Calypogeia fissa]